MQDLERRFNDSLDRSVLVYLLRKVLVRYLLHLLLLGLLRRRLLPLLLITALVDVVGRNHHFFFVEGLLPVEVADKVEGLLERYFLSVAIGVQTIHSLFESKYYYSNV